jgi:hypothetical protein
MKHDHSRFGEIIGGESEELTSGEKEIDEDNRELCQVEVYKFTNLTPDCWFWPVDKLVAYTTESGSCLQPFSSVSLTLISWGLTDQARPLEKLTHNQHQV